MVLCFKKKKGTDRVAGVKVRSLTILQSAFAFLNVIVKCIPFPIYNTTEFLNISHSSNQEGQASCG